MPRLIDDYPGFSELTDYQKKVIRLFVKSGRDCISLSTWVIAEMVTPDKWENPASRGAMVGNVRRSLYGMKNFVGYCPGEGRWDAGRGFLLDEVWDFVNG